MIDQVRNSPSTDPAGLAPPAWVKSWLGAAAAVERPSANITLRRGTTATLVSAVVPGAVHLDADAFQRLVQRTYDDVHAALRDTGHRQIVRMWNHVPAIGQAMGEDVDRYMVFNAGRFAAMTGWYGDRLAAHTPAATGVGHAGDALVVHALAVATPGEPIENPKQVSAYRYSKRYGPLPPCFARATRTRQPRRGLLISGTAAITGEESQHVGELRRQFALTVDHLRTLAGTVVASEPEPLSRLSHVRIYVPRAADRGTIEMLSHAAFRCDVQYLPADLCRPDLLVEIEAYLDLEGSNEP